MSSLILLFLLLAPFYSPAQAGLNEFFDQTNESMKSLASIVSAPRKILASLFSGPNAPLPPKYVKKITAEVADGSEVIAIIKAPPSHTGVSHILPQQRKPYETSAKPAAVGVSQHLPELPADSPLQGPIAGLLQMSPAGLVNRNPNAGDLLSFLPQWMG